LPLVPKYIYDPHIKIELSHKASSGRKNPKNRIIPIMITPRCHNFLKKHHITPKKNPGQDQPCFMASISPKWFLNIL
jgi:hypothetical protein